MGKKFGKSVCILNLGFFEEKNKSRYSKVSDRDQSDYVKADSDQPKCKSTLQIGFSLRFCFLI